VFLDYEHGDREFIMHHLLDAPEMSFDTETTGLDETDRMFCATISTSEHDIYIPRELLWELQEVFNDPTKVWYFQNAKFDMRMARNESIEFAGTVVDIAVTARLIRNDYPKYSLEAQAFREGMQKIDLVKKAVEEKRLYEFRSRRIGPPEKVSRYDWVDRDILRRYAAHDSRITFDLAKIYQSKFSTEEGNHLRVYNNENALTKVCFEIERRGILLDREYTERAMEFEKLKVAASMQEFFTKTGIPFVDSAKRLGPIFQEAGETVSYTEKGNISLTDAVLDSYASPIAQIVRDIRSSQKLISTYFTNYLNMYDRDGVIHPTMWQGGTKTGRFSYSDPNLQNIPKDDPDDKTGFVVRGCFMPRPGNVFLSIDYETQEYMVMLAYANEVGLIRQVMDGLDVHQATANMLGITRKQAKTLNFACIGEGQLVLTSRGLVPIEEVKTDMLLWDGCEWVSHGGVIYKGIQEVITYDGLTATPDHIVFTRSGREIPFGEAANEQGDDGIFTSATGYVPHRYPYSGSERVGSGEKAPDNRSHLQGVRRALPYRSGEHSARSYSKLSVPEITEVWGECEPSTAKPLQKILGCTHSMYESILFLLEKLWRSWNRSTMHTEGILDGSFRQVLGRRDTIGGCGQDEQRGALRNRKLEDRIEVREPAKQKKKVYDILNAGPRSRFTVSGKLVHNCLYGAGPDKIAKMLKVSPIEARRFRDLYFMKLPNVERFIDSVIRTGRSRGFVHNWLGRRLYAEKKFAYALPNHLIQSSCADVVKVAMNALGSSCPIVLQVHDELIFEVPEGSVEESAKKFGKVMADAWPVKNGVALRVSASYSKTSFAKRDLIDV